MTSPIFIDILDGCDRYSYTHDDMSPFSSRNLFRMTSSRRLVTTEDYLLLPGAGLLWVGV